MIENQSLADCMGNFITDTLVASDAVTCLAQPDRPVTKVLKPAIRDLRANLLKANYHYQDQQTNNEQVSLVPLVGLGKRHNILNTYIGHLIASADKELTICTPYFNPPRSILRELRRALRRGVKVTLIVGDKTANDFYIPPEEQFKTIAALPYLYEQNLRNFAKRNEFNIAKRQLCIHLWKHDNNSFHLKGIWVDKQYMLLTGNNLNPRAWKLDLENAILIRDPSELLEEQRLSELDKILEHTQLICSYKMLQKLEDYPLPVKKLLKRIKRIKADHILNQIL